MELGEQRVGSLSAGPIPPEMLVNRAGALARLLADPSDLFRSPFFVKGVRGKGDFLDILPSFIPDLPVTFWQFGLVWVVSGERISIEDLYFPTLQCSLKSFSCVFFDGSTLSRDANGTNYRGRLKDYPVDSAIRLLEEAIG